MNYGKIIRLRFDGKVFNVSSLEKTRYRLINFYGEITYPTNVTYGADDHEIYLHFDDINNLVFPAQFECLRTIKMGSELVSFGAFIKDVALENLHPRGDFEYVELASVLITGENIEAFDGKAYTSEYGTLTGVTVTGGMVELTFKSGYLNGEYETLTGVTVTGTYCDVNGVPI